MIEMGKEILSHSSNYPWPMCLFDQLRGGGGGGGGGTRNRQQRTHLHLIYSDSHPLTMVQFSLHACSQRMVHQ